MSKHEIAAENRAVRDWLLSRGAAMVWRRQVERDIGLLELEQWMIERTPVVLALSEATPPMLFFPVSNVRAAKDMCEAADRFLAHWSAADDRACGDDGEVGYCDAGRRGAELAGLSAGAGYDAGADDASHGIATWLRSHVGTHSLGDLYAELAEEIDDDAWRTGTSSAIMDDAPRGVKPERKPGAWRGQVRQHEMDVDLTVKRDADGEVAFGEEQSVMFLVRVPRAGR